MKLNERAPLSPRGITYLLTLVYFSGYLTRVNFASIIQEVVTDTGFSKSALSVIPVCLFITYAVGQIVNGRLGDKLDPRTLIFCGLAVSSIVNLIFPFCAASLTAMRVLWAINGFVQAMLWPPIIRIMVRSMSEQEYTSNVVLLTMGSTAAKVLIFLLAPAVISLAGWRTVFYICAGFGIVVSALFFLYRARIVMEQPLVSTDPASEEKHPLPRAVWMPLFFIFLAIILHGALRDGLDTWMPSYLVEVFHFGNSEAILSRVLLSLFMLVSILASKWLYRRFFKNEVACCVTLFLVSTLGALLLFFFFDSSAALVIPLMMLVSGIQGGINLMLISYVPKRFRAYGGISTITGLLDAFAYAGSAISTYGVAALAESRGWEFTTGSWLLTSALGTLCVVIAMQPWKRFAALSPEKSANTP